MTMRGFGCVHDHPDVRGSHRYDELCGGVRTVPSSLDLTGLLDGHIADQGGTASCVRHAVARAIQLHARQHGHPDYALPSARHLTYLTMVLLGKAWSWDGTTIEAVATAANGAGLCKESLCPWLEKKDGVVPLDALQNGLDAVGLRTHRLLSDYDARVLDIKNAIAAGCGVVTGTDVDQAFMDLVDSRVWVQTGTRLGAHAQAALDYDEEALRFVGSYGPGFGENGLVRIGWDHIADPLATRSVWIIDVVPNWVGEA